jgi:hypothetical protein
MLWPQSPFGSLRWRVIHCGETCRRREVSDRLVARPTRWGQESVTWDKHPVNTRPPHVRRTMLSRVRRVERVTASAETFQALSKITF